MGTKIDLTNKRFGKLTVLEEAGVSPHGKITWLCRCDCGNTKEVISGNLIQNKSLSCGVCYKIPDLLGKKFGNVTVTKYLGLVSIKNSKRRQAMWLCIDEFGNEKAMRTAEFTARRRVLRNNPRTDNNKYRKNYYGSYKSSAKKDNREFNLDYGTFIKLAESNCSYCGISPGIVKKSRLAKEPCKFNGIDRIDSSKGYTVDNVTSCCITCNRAKSNMPLTEWLDYIKRLIGFNNKQEAGI